MNVFKILLLAFLTKSAFCENAAPATEEGNVAIEGNVTNGEPKTEQTVGAQSQTKETPPEDEILNQAESEISNSETINSANQIPPPPPEGLEEQPLNEPPVPEKTEPAVVNIAPPIGKSNDFSGAPIVPGTLRSLAEIEAPEEYVVEFGDSLFDVCSQLVDEGGYWPKLWTLNPFIKNPHYIWPGMRLVFYPGDEETPPFLQVVEEDDVVPVERNDVDLTKIVSQEITPDTSMTQPNKTAVIGPEDVISKDDNMITEGEFFNKEMMSLQVPGFIFKDEKVYFGKVSGGSQGQGLVSEDEEAVIAVDPGFYVQFKPGQVYSVLRFQNKVHHQVSEDFVGYLYQFVGNIRFVSFINHGDHCLATVLKTYQGLQKDDIIVPFVSTQRSIKQRHKITATKTMDAHIVSFAEPGQDLGGTGDFAFIDRGKADGLSEGEYLKIAQKFHYAKFSNVLNRLPNDALTVGYLHIIDLNEHTALGYIIQNTQEIMLGDDAGKG